MREANPRVEIYFRQKGKRRWYRTGRTYPFTQIEQAQAKMRALFKINKGKKEYLLKPMKR
jgi:hypothetical protein